MSEHHEGINVGVLEQYFAQILNLLFSSSISIMGNATYHSQKAERLSSAFWEKHGIV